MAPVPANDKDTAARTPRHSIAAVATRFRLLAFTAGASLINLV
jgi:hypothetical protein